MAALDIPYYAGNYLAEALDPRFRPPETIGRLMHEGQRGLREGGATTTGARSIFPAYRRATLREAARDAAL